MASDKQLKCGLVISLSDGSNPMSSSDSAKLLRPAPPLVSAASSVKSFHGSSHDSIDSSSQESGPVYLVGSCVHTSAQFMEQHRATLRGQPLPIQSELAAELAAMGACCHLDTASRQSSHHSEVPNLLPWHRWMGAGVTSEETPVRQTNAEMKKSAAAAGVKAAEKLEAARETERKPAPAMVQLQSLRHFTTQTGTAQFGSRTVLTGAESDTIFRHRIVRRLRRVIPLPEADVQAIVDGIHERRGRNFTETKRIVSALMVAAATGAGQTLDRRMEKRNKSTLRLRAGQPNGQLRESSSEGGASTLTSSTVVSGDVLERPSKLTLRSKSSELDPDSQVVCCTELLEGHGEVVRTAELETTMLLPKPPPFELVRTWTFDEAPVRRLRNPSLM